MFEQRTRLIIQEKYMELVGEVIDVLRTMQAHADADTKATHSFDTLWAAFSEQFQQPEDPLDNAYTEIVADICQQTVEQQLTLTELQLLWLVSDGALAWTEEETLPDEEQMIDEVTEELLSWVEQEAEEPELETGTYFDELDIEDNSTRH